MEKITEKFHDDDSSSASDFDDEKSPSLSSVKANTNRLFGREQPLHKGLDGGKPADVLLWKDKKVSGGVLGVATTYGCLSSLNSILFVWSNASTFINRSHPQIPDVVIPDDVVLGVVSALRVKINRALAVLRDIASGTDMKKLLAVIVGLWVMSVVGSWCNLLTLFYIFFVFLLTVPYLCEKYEDLVDPFAEKALAEIKKQYAVFDAKFLSNTPGGPMRDKKLA